MTYEEFAEANSVTIETHYIEKRDEMFHWRVTVKGKHGTFEAPYRAGLAHAHFTKPVTLTPNRKFGTGDRVPFQGRVTLHDEEMLKKWSTPTPPTVDGLLYCLALDSTGVTEGQTFREWCEEWGSDANPADLLDSYEACRQTWANLRQSLGWGPATELLTCEECGV